MGVFTERSFEDVVPVLEEFGLSHDVCAFRGLTEGVENSSFIITTGEGDYILTLIERRVDPDRIQLANALMNAGRKQGLACPSFLTSKNGKVFSEFQERLWVLQTKLQGIALDNPSRAQTETAGRSLATLHLAETNIHTKSENPVGERQWPGLLCALESITPRADFLSQDLIQDINDLKQKWPSNLPSGAIHGDFFKSNVLHQDDRLNIIDLLLCCHDLYVFDLALALTSWGFTNDNTLSPACIEAFLAGYQSIRPLLAEEYSALTYLYRLACIRIVLTRAIDQNRAQRRGAVESKDPRAFYARYLQICASNLF